MNWDKSGRREGPIMTIKALVTDLHGTLLTDSDSLVPDVALALSQLQDMKLRIAVFSNRPHMIVDKKIQLLPISPDLVLTKEDVGIAKGSARWIDMLCSRFGINRNEVVYIGDSINDMTTAVNSKIVYFNAEWSNPGSKYGIPVDSPKILPVILKHFFMKEHLWYWSVDSSDTRGNKVVSKALIRGRDIGVTNFDTDLLRWTKGNIDRQVGLLKMSEFIMYHLLGSLYLDDTYGEIDGWTVVPGHTGKYNASIVGALERTARLFRNVFSPNLVCRHRVAKKSAYLRARGEQADFGEQVSTICLSCEPRYRSKYIEDKTIVVVDDFVTEGFTTEWVRNLLLNAGAKRVVSLAIGAYHDSIEVKSIASGFTWDSFSPVTIDDKYITTKMVWASRNPSAIQTIKDSFSELTK